MKISRRSFLKGGMAAACGLAASAVPGKAIAETGEPLATLLDIRKCVGCGACVDACRDANADKFPVPRKPFPKMVPDRAKPEDWSDRKDETDRLTPYNWLFIQEATVEHGGKEITLNLPRRCMHCTNPPCVKLCPWGAARQTKDGISRIDPDLCLGGSKCKTVCPWQIPQRQSGVGLYLDILPSFAGNGVMYKCDRCYNRLAKGERPACIDACPEGVQTIGPRSQIVEKAKDLARKINGYLYGETENGGTNTIYVSPVPFDVLAEAVPADQPHLKPVRDAMAQTNNLAAAVLLAPVAGIAAAVGKWVKVAKDSESPDQK